MQQTFPQYFTTDPVFEQGFVFLVVNPDADDLTVKILDTKNKDKEVASAVIRVSDIIKKPGMNFEKQPVTLKVGGIVLLARVILLSFTSAFNFRGTAAARRPSSSPAACALSNPLAKVLKSWRNPNKSRNLPSPPTKI